MDSVFIGLKETNHVCDEVRIIDRLLFKVLAEDTGSSTMIYRLVLAANRRMLANIINTD